MDTKCGIYSITNMQNGKRYIGQSVNIIKRWKEHKWALESNVHYNSYLQNAWNKYGSGMFRFEIMCECNKEQLDDKEIYYIKQYHSNESDYGYNLTSGGEGALDVPKEVVEKRKQAFKKFLEEHPEHIELCRNNTKRQFQNEEFYKKYRELRQSEEFRQRESAAHKGKKLSEETKIKIGKASSKPVMCVETGIVYPSCRAANKALPGNKNIQAAADGRRNTAGGFHWCFVDQENTEQHEG